MITHRNAYMNVLGTLARVPMTCAERYLWTLPMFHANGWTFVWIVTAVGGAHVCLRRVEPEAVFGLCAAEGVTMMCAAPTVLIRLANAPAALRRTARPGIRVLTAGAPPAAATIARVEGDFGWEVVHVYGLTETAPFITICEPRPEHGRLSAEERAVIKARQGVELVSSGELRVVDRDGREVPHDAAAMGEIAVRGNVVMQGYFNDPEAMARAFDGGWFHTGDAAVVHPDGTSRCGTGSRTSSSAAGRTSPRWRWRGSCSGIRRCRRRPSWGCRMIGGGKAPHAFVVLKAGASAGEGQLREFARQRLAHFKVPKSFRIVDDLPRTATGKIQKYVLRGGRSAIGRQ